MTDKPSDRLKELLEELHGLYDSGSGTTDPRGLLDRNIATLEQQQRALELGEKSLIALFRFAVTYPHLPWKQCKIALTAIREAQKNLS